MSGATSPLSYTPSWRGAQLKHRDAFTFTLLFLLLYSRLPGIVTQIFIGASPSLDV
jgi:hypothetical protein